MPLSRNLGALTLLDTSGPAWPVGDDITFTFTKDRRVMMITIEPVNLFIRQNFAVNVIAKYFTLTFPHNARSKAVVHMELDFESFGNLF